jgi:DNA mismatch repair protein MutS2
VTQPLPPLVDLDDDSRVALEFDELVAWVASFARTAPGARRVAARVPFADAEVVRAELQAVEEVRRHHLSGGLPLPYGIPDPAAALETLEVAGLSLDARTLRDLASVGMSTSVLRSRLRALDSRDYPWLRQTGEGLPELAPTCRAIVDGVEPEGRIRDAASAELRSVRLEAGRAGGRLRRTLERLVRDPNVGTVIRDDFITQRNGRYVVPVRSDAPRPLRGIVHAASSSGATQFVEPLETIELNNDLVRLAEREREEELRLLAAWTDNLRARLGDLGLALHALAEVDDAQARALFAEECRAVTPAVGVDGGVVLREARHPLVDRRLREGGAGCVPLGLELDPAEQVLVVSGPNAGGKTVLLKTLGLYALMAQSGIPVPAREVRLPCYEQVRVDIGDHQSIQADLSTYSAHVRAIAGFLEGVSPPALFLIDEIGSGTEPGEGAALARAVLEWLVGSRVTAVATTHLGELKTWAIGSGKAACAAMEFDAERMRPTFRVVMGATGTSAGLEIARRMGLSEKIIERATEHLGPDSRTREGYLQRLRELVASAEAERSALLEERREFEAVRRQALQRQEREHERWRKSSSEKLERTLRDIRERGRKELARIRDGRERKKTERRWSRATNALDGEARRFKSEISAQAVDAGGPLPDEIPVGLRVCLLSLGREGVVVETGGDRVKVRVGEVVIDARRADLRLPSASGSGKVSATAEAGQRSVLSVSSGRASDLRHELKLMGKSADEAIEELDKYLDAALLAGQDEIRIVHGHGTGRLRRAVRLFLDDHPLVARHRPGRPEEGGDGATIAILV